MVGITVIKIAAAAESINVEYKKECETYLSDISNLIAHEIADFWRGVQPGN